MLYRRGNVWWYKFRFAGRVFRESTKTSSKALARQAERKRHQSLEEGLHGIKKRVAPITFSTAAADWLKLKKPTLSPKSHRIEEVNLEKHLKPTFGSLLLIDITADDIAAYQKERLREGASPKTINLELGTLRAILRRHRICPGGRVKTGHFVDGQTRPFPGPLTEMGEFYCGGSSVRKSGWTLVRQLRGPHLSTWA